MVVDDTYAVMGTSHLWPRDLSFEGGLAGAVVDEGATTGHPTAVQGVPRHPPRPAAEHESGQRSPRSRRGGGGGWRPDLGRGGRAGHDRPVSTPHLVPTVTDTDLRNRDGSPVGSIR